MELAPILPSESRLDTKCQLFVRPASWILRSTLSSDFNGKIRHKTTATEAIFRRRRVLESFIWSFQSFGHFPPKTPENRQCFSEFFQSFENSASLIVSKQVVFSAKDLYVLKRLPLTGALLSSHLLTGFAKLSTAIACISATFGRCW